MSAIKEKLAKYTQSYSPSSMFVSMSDYYSLSNISKCQLFKGEYINFGLWEGIDPDGPISDSLRSLASRQLYLKVLSYLDNSKPGNILELGFGLGKGIELLCETYGYADIIGVDISNDHYQYVKSKINGNNRNIRLINESIDNIDLRNLFMDAVVSVEVLQHCNNLEKTFDKVCSHTKDGGEFIFCTFFATEPYAIKHINIPTIADGIDNIIDIFSVERMLRNVGFTEVFVSCISEHVWEGFNRWIMQTEYRNSWNLNWYNYYINNYIGYYIVKAIK